MHIIDENNIEVYCRYPCLKHHKHLNYHKQDTAPCSPKYDANGYAYIPNCHHRSYYSTAYPNIYSGLINCTSDMQACLYFSSGLVYLDTGFGFFVCLLFFIGCYNCLSKKSRPNRIRYNTIKPAKITVVK